MIKIRKSIISKIIKNENMGLTKGQIMSKLDASLKEIQSLYMQHRDKKECVSFYVNFIQPIHKEFSIIEEENPRLKELISKALEEHTISVPELMGIIQKYNNI